MLFQTLCKSKVGWDDELEGFLLDKWVRLTEDLTLLLQIKVPRCYYVANQSLRLQQLHGFSDASKDAYAAVIYLRSVYCKGEVDIRLVASKTRVASQTIPRLELLGATILAQLMDTISSSLSFKAEHHYWTDSYTVLCWIRNEKHWRQYVQHRVDEIRKLSNQDKWKFCPGQYNPADIPSRLYSIQKLISRRLWWNGPEFLKKPVSEWPNPPMICDKRETEQELLKNTPILVHFLLLNASEDGGRADLDAIIDIQRYSRKLKLLRVTGWVFKLDQTVDKNVTAIELTEAELKWLKSIQQVAFGTEYKELLSGKNVVYNCQLILFLDNGIIRCRGRVNKAHLPTSAKNPVLLPEKHYFSCLLVKEKHELP